MAALFDLAEIHHVVQRHLAEAFLARELHDVTPPQGAVLAVLFDEGGVSTTARIAARLGLADVTVGRFVTALERSGYVAREPNPDDRRERLVRPTAKARRRLPDFAAVTNQVLDLLFGPDPAEVDRLAAALQGTRHRVTTAGAPAEHRLLPTPSPRAT